MTQFISSRSFSGPRKKRAYSSFFRLLIPFASLLPLVINATRLANVHLNVRRPYFTPANARCCPRNPIARRPPSDHCDRFFATLVHSTLVRSYRPRCRVDLKWHLSFGYIFGLCPLRLHSSRLPCLPASFPHRTRFVPPVHGTGHLISTPPLRCSACLALRRPFLPKHHLSNHSQELHRPGFFLSSSYNTSHQQT